MAMPHRTQAADRVTPGGLSALAVLRERAGDPAGAEALYRQAADRRRHPCIAGPRQDAAGTGRRRRGDTSARQALAWLREQAGDPAGAERIRRFGLTGDGSAAESLEW